MNRNDAAQEGASRADAEFMQRESLAEDGCRFRSCRWSCHVPGACFLISGIEFGRSACELHRDTQSPPCGNLLFLLT